ncbi:hypothetical protein [Pseudomonas sp. MWU13-3659]|uniref:hypothetical protein n=1 Tax=Pseudomonas sp. MWU13-3659 TaxID=2986964 RepID=UPI002074F3D2|nr:hypothetical protein [Pseudomonas sp. MWU13-3659]
MKLLLLGLFSMCDVVISLFLNRFVFKDMDGFLQFLGSLLFHGFMGGVYIEMLGGEGLIQFPYNSITDFGFWLVVFLTVTMFLFHIWAMTSRSVD